MQHAGQTHVVNIDEPAGGLGRKIHPRRRRADDAARRSGLDRRVGRKRKADPLASDQFAIGHAAIVAGLRLHDAVLDDEIRRRDAERLGRLAYEPMARLRRRYLQGLGAELDGLAGDGRPLIGRDRAVAEHHRDAFECDIELLRDDLRQGRAHASAEIDMAVEGGDFAGGADQDEGFEILGRRRIERRIRRRRPDHRKRPERLEIVGASQTLRLKRHHP